MATGESLPSNPTTSTFVSTTRVFLPSNQCIIGKNSTGAPQTNVALGYNFGAVLRLECPHSLAIVPGEATSHEPLYTPENGPDYSLLSQFVGKLIVSAITKIQSVCPACPLREICDNKGSASNHTINDITIVLGVGSKLIREPGNSFWAQSLN